MTDRYGAHPDGYDPDPALNLEKDSQHAAETSYPGYASQGQPSYGAQDLNRTSPLAVTGFVLALVSLIVNFFGLVNLAALVVSIIGLNREVKGQGMKGRGFALAGIIISAVGFVLGVIAIILLLAILASGGNGNCVQDAAGVCRYTYPR